MNTLLVSEIFPPQTGGSGRWFHEIYRRLPQQCVQVAAGVHVAAENFDAAQRLRIHRLPLRLPAWGVASLAGLRGYGRAIRALRRLIRSEQIAMLHCGRCLPEGVMALALQKLTGVRYACYVHGEDVGMALTSREFRLLVRRVFARAEFLIANSNNTAQMLYSDWSIPAGRVHVLHPGVDTQRFVPAEPNFALRRSWGWRTVLLTVGRLQLRKGHDMLIRALPLIRQRIPDVLYAIVGEGEERGRLEALAISESVDAHVQFLGELGDEELIPRYQQCDLFVLPNRQVGRDIEGFGMVLLEAQACGRPVLAGASGGTAETMSIPGTGRVIAAETPGPLAAEIIDLLGDRERLGEMGQVAREWVVRNFDWDTLTERARRLFDLHANPREAAVEVQAVAT